MPIVSMLAVVASAADLPEGVWRAGTRLEEMEGYIHGRVDAVVAGLSVVERGAARWALNRATAPCDRVTLAEQDGELAITCGDRKTDIAPPDGTPIEFLGDDGWKLRLVHQLFPDGSVVQTFRGRHGTRVNRFVPDPEGGLMVEVTIRSPQLPDELQYELHYD
jgi:hypothetical protein